MTNLYNHKVLNADSDTEPVHKPEGGEETIPGGPTTPWGLH